MRPLKTVLYMLVVALILGVVSLIFTFWVPKEGIVLLREPVVPDSLKIEELDSLQRETLLAAGIESQPVFDLDSNEIHLLDSLGVYVNIPEEQPEGKVKFALQFPTIQEMFVLEDEAPKQNMEEILLAMKKAKEDSLAAEADAAQAREDSIKFANKRIQLPEGDASFLHPCFAQLRDARRSKSPMRVLHYGDSQIEGDRMTGYIREKFQSRFGGSGPGLVPLVPVVPSISVTWSQAPNMTRYTYFGTRSPLVKHNHYGPLATFARYAPVVQDSFANDSTFYESWLRVNRSGNAYASSKRFNRVRLFYGYNYAPVNLKFFADGGLVGIHTLEPRQTTEVMSWDFDQTPKEMTMVFEGYDSPDLFAVSLESQNGVVVDNIAMRGSSGTLFSRLDRGMLNKCYDSLNVKLVLLQFGGNTVPYMDGEEEAANYGDNIKRQINWFKNWIPGVAIIVVGPADMSIKEKDRYITHPMVPVVRDALKKAAFESGAGYFDVYEAMGGANSMPTWVESNMAAPDYTHFSRKGSNEIAALLVDSFMDEYDKWEEATFGK